VFKQERRHSTPIGPSRDLSGAALAKVKIGCGGGRGAFCRLYTPPLLIIAKLDELGLCRRTECEQILRCARVQTDTSDTVSVELGAIRETVETAA
jgi:hypothetical protein